MDEDLKYPPTTTPPVRSAATLKPKSLSPAPPIRTAQLTRPAITGRHNEKAAPTQGCVHLANTVELRQSSIPVLAVSSSRKMSCVPDDESKLANDVDPVTVVTVMGREK